MGYNSTAFTPTITAKLTPLGRQLLVSTNNALITNFSLGDSDANYYASFPLTTGQIPAEAGEIGSNNFGGNGTQPNARIKSLLKLNTEGLTQKSVEAQSITVTTEVISNGLTIVSGATLSQVNVNRTNYLTDSLVNLFYSFGLPLNSSDDILFTATTSINGGFSDTALSGIAQNNVLVLAIDNTQYGETIDGKTIKVELPTTGGTYTLYSTFQNKGKTLASEDANIIETGTAKDLFGDNIAFLFSDIIKTPNGGNPSLSWSTGYGLNKPYTLNNKSLFNLQTNSSIGLSADTVVGIAYLDSGLIVVTDPTIVSNYIISNGTGATISFDSVSTSVFQNITCIAGRGEFGSSNNKTFSVTDNTRISEIGLYDVNNNLIAIAKTDQHIVKNVNEFLAIGIKILI